MQAKHRLGIARRHHLTQLGSAAPPGCAQHVPAALRHLYGSQAMRPLLGMAPERDPVPGKTTMPLRRLPEEKRLRDRIFEDLWRALMHRRPSLYAGAVAVPAIIPSSSSTTNEENACTLAMHQSKKNGARHFGMKGHCGIGNPRKAIHTGAATPSNPTHC